MSALRVEQSSRLRRTRSAASFPCTTWPELRERQSALLKDWLRSDASERQWQTLLDAAGPDRLDLADELRDLLLHAGVLQTKEHFSRGQWLVERVRWSDVPALQQVAGLRTAAERESSRSAITAQLQMLAQDTPWLESAARHCLDARVGDNVRTARLELLHALHGWHQQQRFGLWRDFALHARGTTKSITPTEWKWLEAHVPLESLGIARFAPMLWLAGELTLHTSHGDISVAAAGMCGLPTRLFSQSDLHAQNAPAHYWLIENRASFERQATHAPERTCLIWLPGRPCTSWCEAVQALLAIAPAPARISCDPDPAGVEIALTAGALWQQAGQTWTAFRMQREDWERAPAIALTADDVQWLDRLQARDDLPRELQRLCADLRDTGRKAEQEAWL
ncbi:hypothetical protein [Diaphorobacter sp.]|uniref:hypothetical protein n=1 Tax=Diaphorobacter sp. TaxID=1934310 RepID=UPI0028AB937B|nr:hypothetical protein [Diaphorobacter sp.]